MSAVLNMNVHDILKKHEVADKRPASQKAAEGPASKRLAQHAATCRHASSAPQSRV